MTQTVVALLVLRVLQIVSDDKRMIEEDFLAFGGTDTIRNQVFIEIAVIPLEPRAFVQSISGARSICS